MKEIGKIVEIKGDNAVVLMKEAEKCKGCSLCKKIIPREPVIEAENVIKAEVGDNVEIEVNEDALFKISLFIYGFPLLGFILGVFCSYFVNNIYLKFPVFLFFLIFFWFYGFKKSKVYSEKTKPEIVKKI